MFNCFKELTHEHLVKAFPFKSVTSSSTSSSQARQFWMLSYANALVSRLILAELTWICHLVSLLKIRFSYLTMLYCNIALQMGVSIHWTGLLDWTTGLKSFWIWHINGVMQIINLVYVDHAITYKRVLVYLC